MTDIGHNSGDHADITFPSRDRREASATDDRLRLLVERVERLEEEKKALTEDIAEVYAEAKAVGYDAKLMRKIVALRKMDPHKRREEEEILDLYKAAVGLG